MIYQATGSLRAIQFLLGRTKIENTVRVSKRGYRGRAWNWQSIQRLETVWPRALSEAVRLDTSGMRRTSGRRPTSNALSGMCRILNVRRWAAQEACMNDKGVPKSLVVEEHRMRLRALQSAQYLSQLSSEHLEYRTFFAQSCRAYLGGGQLDESGPHRRAFGRN